VTGRDPSGHLPSDPARSFGRRPHLQRSFEQFNVLHDYLRASFPVVSRQTGGPPVDGRSRHSLPIILTYDTTRLPRTNEFPVAGRRTRGLPVDYRHRNVFRTFPYTTRRVSDVERRRTLARRRRPGGPSPSPGDCSSRSAELEDFSAGSPRDHRPHYSIEPLAFLGRFLPRCKVGPTNASPPSRLRPHMLYIVGCAIATVARPDTSAV